MRTDRKLYELLAAYLGENVSGAEKVSVEKWINESAENHKFFKEVYRLWQNSGVRLQYTNLDSMQLLLELQIRIREQQSPADKTPPVIERTLK